MDGTCSQAYVMSFSKLIAFAGELTPRRIALEGGRSLQEAYW